MPWSVQVFRPVEHDKTPGNGHVSPPTSWACATPLTGNVQGLNDELDGLQQPGARPALYKTPTCGSGSEPNTAFEATPGGSFIRPKLLHRPPVDGIEGGYCCQHLKDVCQLLGHVVALCGQEFLDFLGQLGHEGRGVLRRGGTAVSG